MADVPNLLGRRPQWLSRRSRSRMSTRSLCLSYGCMKCISFAHFSLELLLNRVYVIPAARTGLVLLMEVRVAESRAECASTAKQEISFRISVIRPPTSNLPVILRQKKRRRYDVTDSVSGDFRIPAAHFCGPDILVRSTAVRDSSRYISIEQGANMQLNLDDSLTEQTQRRRAEAFEALQDLIEWMDEDLDGHVGAQYIDQPLAQDWARVAKVGEEAGEVIDAFIGITGQNPRKGEYGDLGDLFTELADLALTGLYAIQHFTKDSELTLKILLSRAVAHRERRHDG